MMFDPTYFLFLPGLGLSIWTKTLALSTEVSGSDSVAAVGVATHEAGHAIQHATR